jgi:hypothetical protein
MQPPRELRRYGKMTLKATIQKNLLFGFVWAMIFLAVADRSLEARSRRNSEESSQ